MNALDVLIVILIAACVIFAVRAALKGGGRGNCCEAPGEQCANCKQRDGGTVRKR